MRAGSLRRRVRIQIQQATQDALGQPQSAWVDYMTAVPADIQALSGRELIAAQALNAAVTHQICVRYTSRLADPLRVAAMRAIYQNDSVTRYFNVQSAINVDERNREINLLAVEGLNQG